MSLNLSSSSLRGLIPLVEKRERLIEELSAVEGQITAALGGNAALPDRTAKRKGRGGSPAVRPTRPAGKRGKTKERILEALKAAGATGIAVKTLSSNLGLKNQNVHVWLSTTGKKFPEIERLGTGVYRFNSPAAGEETPPAQEKASRPRKIRNSKRKAAPRKSQ